MTAVIAPARLACDMPFLLENHFDAIGDLGVVRDEDWDELIRLMDEKLNYVYHIVETDRGPFMVVSGKLEKEDTNEKTEL